jgi:hypothetical protein
MKALSACWRSSSELLTILKAMISLKLLAGLILSSLLLVSCTPPLPPGHRPGDPLTNPALAPNQPYEKTIDQLERELAERKAEEKRRIAARERSIEAAAQNQIARENPGVTNPATTPTTKTTPPVKPKNTGKKTYRTARSIPGKAGYVFNPWTLEPVDVRGIPSGSLVQDPNDPDKSIHRFRVP